LGTAIPRSFAPSVKAPCHFQQMSIERDADVLMETFNDSARISATPPIGGCGFVPLARLGPQQMKLRSGCADRLRRTIRAMRKT
jgi:hypothetical protein